MQFRRGATFEGSRGFQPTVSDATRSSRRGATIDGGWSRSIVAPRQMRMFDIADRGLKPTATIVSSLRDGPK